MIFYCGKVTIEKTKLDNQMRGGLLSIKIIVKLYVKN
jgi:hypothetical protein